MFISRIVARAERRPGRLPRGHARRPVVAWKTRADLAKAGLTDIHIMPSSFLAPDVALRSAAGGSLPAGAAVAVAASAHARAKLAASVLPDRLKRAQFEATVRLLNRFREPSHAQQARPAPHHDDRRRRHRRHGIDPQFHPTDSTTNPSLILKATELPAIRASSTRRSSGAARPARRSGTSPTASPSISASRSLKIVPGRVSTEVDADLSFDTEAMIAKGRKLIAAYCKERGIGPDRILIKLASTWEGVRPPACSSARASTAT